jgi:hypothetical protein
MVKIPIVVMLSWLLLVSSALAQANVLQTVYQIRATVYKNDDVKLNEITSFNSTISSFPSLSTGYYIKVISSDGKILFNENLGVSFITILDPVGVINKNETSITAKVPYYPNAQSISIYHNEKKILDIDLSKQLCNNNSICEPGENKFNCNHDCKLVQTPLTFSSYYVYILIVAFILLAILIFNYIRLRKKSPTYSQLKQKWS